jgi:hypothetical protein
MDVKDSDARLDCYGEHTGAEPSGLRLLNEHMDVSQPVHIGGHVRIGQHYDRCCFRFVEVYREWRIGTRWRH